MTSVSYKLHKGRFTLGVFESIHHSLSNQNLLHFVSRIVFDFVDEFLLSLDNFLIFAVSDKLQV